MIGRVSIPLAAAALVGVAACARQQAPSGGPTDHRPPVIVRVRPDTFARIEAGGGKIRIEFDESISENPVTGTLDQAVEVSPRTGEVEVDHAGDALEVSIKGGFRAGVVYRITVLPVVQDRFRNALLDPFEWVFSTGPDFEATALAGEVWGRTDGQPVPSLDVFAVSDDSVRYSARTDSLGLFAMRYLPQGVYRLQGFEDRNANDSADVFEIQGVGEPVTLGPTDTLITSFWVMLPDTTPPQVARGEKIDSVTLRLIFDDFLDPEQSLDGLVRGMYRDSANTPAVDTILHPWEYEVWADSVADVRAAEAAAIAAAAPPDTAGAEPDPGIVPPGAPASPAAGTDDEVERFLPDGQRIPEREVILLLRGPIEGGDLYTVLLGPVTNISGLVSDESEGVFRLPDDPRPPPADTAVAEPVVVPDTAAIRPPPPDTGSSRSPTPFQG